MDSLIGIGLIIGAGLCGLLLLWSWWDAYQEDEKGKKKDIQEGGC